jgi:hypothetical protein
VPRNRPARVSIGDRAFELGAVYAPRNGFGCCRQLLAYEPDGEWPGGKVVTWLISRSGSRRDPVCGTWWARWAGGRVVEVEE